MGYRAPSGMLLALLGMTTAGCESGEPTEILLTVQSDLVVSDDPAVAEMDTIRVRILRFEARGEPGAEETASPPPLDMEVGQPVTVAGDAYTFRWAKDFPIEARTLPLEIGTAPEGGDADRVALFDAYALKDGEVVVAARVRAGYVRGRVLRVLLTLHAACRDAECPPDQTCQDGMCVPVDRECLVDCDAGVGDDDAGVDAGPDDAGPPPQDGGGVDAGPSCDPAACDDGDPCNGIEGCVSGRCAPGTPLDCDDGVACTADSCGATGCQNVPTDSLCTAAPEGRCDARSGCQYPACTASTCTPGPCQTARCEGDTCVRTSTCSASQMCCAGSCVPAGCADGNPCTTDTCGTSGCVHTNNSNPCSDGLYCNGADTCGGGSCSVHAGTPCSMSTPYCLEGSNSCVACTTDSHCGTVTFGTWSACDWEFACDEMAQRTREVYTPDCVSNVCSVLTTTETEACTRDTDGRSCGMGTTYGPWSTCSYASVCDEEGSRTREVTTRSCVSGTCNWSTSTETETGGACARDTDGTPCDDDNICTEGDQCSSGFCLGDPCFRLTCGPSSIGECTASGCACVPF